ncbi:MAG: sterol desaturase family protein [Candidatus Cyclobacteriaceae bacterium M2_1C_046]
MEFFFPILDYYGGPALFILFIILLVLESYFTLRFRTENKKRRLIRNGGIAVIGFAFFRLAVIPVLVFAAKWAGEAGIGFFNWITFPGVLELILTFLLLDYGMYIWHRMNHNIPLLWRFHNVHHTDLDLDVTTAVRFHFGELFFSIFFRSAIIIMIGASVTNLLLYEIFFQAATAFHHSNLKLPKKLENKLVKVIVTPRMHGIHHSIYKKETDSNYATIFSFWDKLHKTKILSVPQRKITIGVPAWRDHHELKITSLIMMPFSKQREWKLPDGRKPIKRKNS